MPNSGVIYWAYLTKTYTLQVAGTGLNPVITFPGATGTIALLIGSQTWASGLQTNFDADLLDGVHKTSTNGQVEASTVVVADASRGLYNITQLGINKTANDAGYEFQIAAVGTANCDMRMDAGTGQFIVNVAYNGNTTLTFGGTQVILSKPIQHSTAVAAGTDSPTHTNAPALDDLAPKQWIRVYATDGTACVMPIWATA